MDNLDAVLTATRALMADWGLGWSPKRITVSTVGLRKGLRRFLEESPCHLAVSLHNPLPAERAALMPAERAWSLTEVVATLREFFGNEVRSYELSGDEVTAGASEPAGNNLLTSELKTHNSTQRRLTFEYIVFKGINDTRRHADALIRLLKPLRCRVNLIPFHTIPETPLVGASREEMMALRDYLTEHGVFTMLRASRGQDIYAACGLLHHTALTS